MQVSRIGRVLHPPQTHTGHAQASQAGFRVDRHVYQWTSNKREEEALPPPLASVRNGTHRERTQEDRDSDPHITLKAVPSTRSMHCGGRGGGRFESLHRQQSPR